MQDSPDFESDFESPETAVEAISEAEQKPKNKRPWTAQNKLMDYLARRDHSEKELREKLSRNFEFEEIDRAIQIAKDSGWMADPQELAEKVAKRLLEKGKGSFYIKNYLLQKGLPALEIDEELEIDRGRELVAPLIERGEDYAKKQRYLKNRGYSPGVIRKVLSE